MTLSLRTLGGLSLLRDGRPVAETQRKPLALLALLAAHGNPAGTRGLSRDKLMAYLWTESDAGRARGALKQTLYKLKHDLGCPDLIAGGVELRLNPDVISVDVWEFERAIAVGDHTSATRLYAGPFLDGVFLSDAKEFEEWCAIERRRLARLRESLPPDLHVVPAALAVPTAGLAAPPTPPGPRPLPHRGRWYFAGALGGMLLLGVVAISHRDGEAAEPAPGSSIALGAVVATDSAAIRVASGLAELAASSLNATPVTLIDLRETRDSTELLRLARQHAADVLISMSIATAGGRYTATMHLIDPGDPAHRDRVTLGFSQDSLQQAASRLVVRALPSAVRVGSFEALDLFTTSPAAAAWYLSGREAQRSGRFDEAIVAFREALALDSNFASAGLALMHSAEWASNRAELRAEGFRAAHRSRPRLSPADRADLDAVAGAYYLTRCSWRDYFDSVRVLATRYPGQAFSWFQYGDQIYHYAAAHGLDPSLGVAEAALTRGLDLDPGNAPILEHLVEIAALRNDTVAVRRDAERYLALSAKGDLRFLVGWRAAVALDDDRALKETRAAIGGATTDELERLLGMAQLAGLDSSSASLAARELARRSGATPEGGLTFIYLHQAAMNAGRAPAGQSLIGLAGAYPTRLDRLEQTIADGLFWSGDAGRAAQAAREMRLMPAMAGGPDTDLTRARTACWPTLWTLSADSLIDRAQAHELAVLAVSGSPAGRAVAEICRSLVLATEAVRRRADDRLVRLEETHEILRLDYLNGLPLPGWPRRLSEGVRLALARLLAEDGQAAEALQVLGERPNYWGTTDYLSSMLALQEQLARQAGDSAIAERTSQHLRVLRAIRMN